MKVTVLYVIDQGRREIIGVFESDELAQAAIDECKEKFHEPARVLRYLDRKANDPRRYEYQTEVFTLNENGLA